MSARVLLFAATARYYSYYRLADDYLWGDDTTLWAGILLEVIWQTFSPDELHAIKLSSGETILRYVRSAIVVDGQLVLEMHGGNAAEVELQPVMLIERTGRINRAFYVRDGQAFELPDYRVLLRATG